jgi:DNA-binding XRE family transcriptional regulator
MEKGWIPLEELPRPRIRPSLDEILAGLGPIKTLGQRIRYFRIKNGLKQKDLGKKLGVGKTSVCQWERGDTSPKRRHFKALSGVLGVSLEY